MLFVELYILGIDVIYMKRVYSTVLRPRLRSPACTSIRTNNGSVCTVHDVSDWIGFAVPVLYLHIYTSADTSAGQNCFIASMMSFCAGRPFLPNSPC